MGSVRVDMAQRRDRVRERQSNTESGMSYQAIVGRLRELEELVIKKDVELIQKNEELKQVKREYQKVRANESRLEERVKELTPKCIDLEEKLRIGEEEHEKALSRLVKDLWGIEGAVGGMTGAVGGMTSTPVAEKGYRDWSGRLEGLVSPQDYTVRKKGGVKGGKHEGKGGGKHEGKGGVSRKLKTATKHSEKYESKDSLYSSSRSALESDSCSSSSESETEEGASVSVRRSVLIREVPRISRFRLAGSQDIVDFFKEYERYCQEKLGSNKKFWVKELGEFLDDRLEGVLRAIVSVGEPKYEVVKERVIAHVRRIKGGVKYRKRNDFEEARMEKGERLETYAHRLESLARKKYGDEEINKNKELMRKFLATVPSSIRETVNAMRKDKKKWHNRRLMWEDILEMIEDREIEDSRASREDKEDMEIMIGREKSRSSNRKTYKDAVIGNTVEVMAKFLEEYERDREKKDEGGWTQVGRNRDRNRNRRPDRNSDQDRRTGQTRDRVNIIRCTRCGRAGHMKRDCAWANGTCFGCGQGGHLVGNCPNPVNIKCFRCGGLGHRASECNLNVTGMNGNVCGNCGQSGHFARMCQFPRSTCGNCGIMGHTASVCRRFVGVPSQALGTNRNVTQEGATGGQGNMV